MAKEPAPRPVKPPRPKPPKEIGRLRKPDYVKKRPVTEEIEEIFCKGCGDVIANLSERPFGDGSRTRLTFTRLPNYAEVKFRCEDGHFHVTNGCQKCVNMSMNLKYAQGFLEADYLEQGIADPETRVLAIVTVDTSGAGIV